MARKTKKRIKKTAFSKKMGSDPKSVASARESGGTGPKKIASARESGGGPRKK